MEETSWVWAFLMASSKSSFHPCFSIRATSFSTMGCIRSLLLPEEESDEGSCFHASQERWDDHVSYRRGWPISCRPGRKSGLLRRLRAKPNHQAIQLSSGLQERCVVEASLDE